VKRLRESPGDLAALITRSSGNSGIPASFVEKDFWVVELLRSVAQPSVGGTLIFKGGTSLSKAYELIQRFSEDVDVLVVPDGKQTEGARDRFLKATCTRVEADLGVESSPVFSKRGISRSVRYVYPRSFTDTSVTEGVLLEIGIRGGPNPNEMRSISSYVAGQAMSDGASAKDYEELSPVSIHVLRPERTLVEKLSIVHHLASQGDAEIRASEKGRHFYDIYRLLGDASVQNAISKAGFVSETAADTERRSAVHSLPYVSRPSDGFASSAAFSSEGPLHAALSFAYSRASSLIYGPRPTFEEVIERVRSHANLL
jgi:hypothetical protein